MWLHKFKSIESLVCLFNLIFILTGCVIVVLGVHSELNMYQFFDIIGNSDLMEGFILSPKVSIVFGSLLIVYSLLAVLSSCEPDRNRRRHCGVAVVMGLILVAEICLVVMMLIFKDKVFSTLSISMTKSVQNYKEHKSESIRYSWESLQRDFECCGITNFDTWKMDNESLFPNPCCYLNEFGHCDTDNHHVWKIGCLEVVSHFMREKAFSSCLVGSVIVMIQMIDVISAFCLVIKCKNHQTYQKAPIIYHFNNL